METFENPKNENNNPFGGNPWESRMKSMNQEWKETHRRGRLTAGIFLFIIGGMLLFQEVSPYEFSDWVFSGGTLLFVIGLYSTIKHKFSRMFGPILMGIGVILNLHMFFPAFNAWNYVWPIALMFFGAVIVLKPKRKDQWGDWAEKKGFANINDSDIDYMEVNAVFGGVKKSVSNRDFKGGEINAVFGGAEINLLNCDFNGRVTLEVNQVFGGTKLIIPSNWVVKSEVTAVLGSVEDKRSFANVQQDENKVLVLNGNAVFGGIDIRSF